VVAGQWVLVGSSEWAASHPAVTGSVVGSLTSGTFTINGTTVTVGAGDDLDDVVTTINTLLIVNPSESEPRGVFAKNINSRLYLYTNAINDTVGDSTLSNAIVIANPSTGAVLTSLGIASGSYYGPALQMTPHTQVPQWKDSGAGQTKRPTGSVWIKTTEPGAGARWRIKRWNAATETWVSAEAPIYASNADALFFLDRAGGGQNIPADRLYVQSNADENSGFDDTPATATFRMWKRVSNSPTSIISAPIASATLSSGSKTWTISQTMPGRRGFVSKTITFTAAGTAADAFTIAGAINAIENFGFDNTDPLAPVELTSYVSASVSEDKNELVISHTRGGEIRFTVSGASETALTSLFTEFNLNTGAGTKNFYPAPTGAAESYVVSNWQPFAYSEFAALGDPPLNEAADGQLWYNPSFGEIDIMVHNGSTWKGYREVFSATDPAGPIISATRPADGDRSDGGDLVNNDLWISTADSENFPTIYRYTGAGTTAEGWVLVDKTDQETEEGVLFADARYGLSGANGNTAAPIEDYYATTGASYLDPDAPDPDNYPQGMLLWNLRRSSGNVKRYRNNYINTAADNTRFNNNESMDAYATDRWTTASPNNEDGSGSFGRKAQRAVVVAALKSAVDTSQEIRDEERRNFNLIACPGYPELMSNLVNLNIDRGITAFVIGDTPLRLASDATTLTRWGSNAELVTDNGDDGITTFDEYLGVFYPSGFTTDLSGSNAVVPSSHMMLKTIALSDNATYPWFAPAGTRRGGITNATSVGYIDAQSGEFQTVALNEGQRDTLYDLKINPITFFNGVGHVNYGQKTRARNASALDRINVARLTVYLRSQLNKLARPYIFEPNDKITRDEIKQSVESLLLELVGLRALFDFAVVCDETNNTPARIDRNELWVDIAIEPVKAIEFIYIPLRLKNTGEI
jgi:hypothetical protein